MTRLREDVKVREDPKSPALRQGVDFRGTPNSTTRVTEYVKPGKERAPFLRYIKINLPRTTKAVLLLVMAAVGAASASVALSGHEPFMGANIALWAVFGLAVAFVAVGVTTAKRIWGFGALISALTLVVYVVGCFGDAPFVWNGGSVVLAATWNLLVFLPLAYLVLFGALRYGMIVAYPDDQNFMD